MIVDSFYGGIELAEELNKDGSLFVMASQCGRPQWLFGKKEGRHKGLKKHEWDYRVSKDGSIVAVSFHDSGKINFFLNVHVCITHT